MAARTNAAPEPTTPAPEPEGSGERCSNCGEPAIVTTDGKVANKVSFCAAHKPDNIEAPPAKAPEPAADAG
jgi:hypothetical protein